MKNYQNRIELQAESYLQFSQFAHIFLCAIAFSLLLKVKKVVFSLSFDTIFSASIEVLFPFLSIFIWIACLLVQISELDTLFFFYFCLSIYFLSLFVVFFIFWILVNKCLNLILLLVFKYCLTIWRFFRCKLAITCRVFVCYGGTLFDCCLLGTYGMWRVLE